MGQRIIAVVAGMVLVSVAAAGAFASQDQVETQGELTATPTDTEMATPTDEATEEPTATATEEPSATDTPDATATSESTPTPEATATPGNGSEDEGVHGIPDSNPSKRPNDDDSCEKGETEIKTTPSGNQVMVPCHVADKEHKGKGHQSPERSGRGEDEGDEASEEEEGG